MTFNPERRKFVRWWVVAFAGVAAFPWIGLHTSATAESKNYLALCNSGGPIFYVIQPRETLSGLAAKFKMSVSDIAGLNPLETRNPNEIISGHVLVLPQSACEIVESTGGNFAEGTRHLAREVEQGGLPFQIAESLAGRVVYPFDVRRVRNNFEVTYQSGSTVRQVWSDPDTHQVFVTVKPSRGSELMYTLDNLIVEIGAITPAEQRLWSERGKFGSSFAALSERDQREIVHRASQIIAGGKTSDAYFLAYIHYPSGKSELGIVNDLVLYKTKVEDNRTLMEMRSQLRAGLAPLNRFVAQMADPSQFSDGKITELTTEMLDYVRFVHGANGFGGGLSSDITSGGQPGILIGHYDDEQFLYLNSEEALKVLAHDSVHELLIHGALQVMSRNAANSMVYARDGQTEFKDWLSATTHSMMGVAEYSFCYGVGVKNRYPDWQVFYLFDRLTLGGLSDQDAIKLLFNVSVHGVNSDLLSGYESGKLHGDPSLKEMFEDERVPEIWLSEGVEDRMLSIISRISGLEPPSHYEADRPLPAMPIFDGPEENAGWISPVVKSQGARVRMYLENPASIGFQAEARPSLERELADLLRDKNYLKPDNDGNLLAWFFRADGDHPTGFLSRLTTAWKNAGSPSKVDDEKFRAILKAASPNAFQFYIDLERGPDLHLIPQDTRADLVVAVPQAQWPKPDDRLYCQVLVESKFMDPGAGGEIVSSRTDADGQRAYLMWVTVGDVRPDENGNLLIECPEGEPGNGLGNMRIGFWDNTAPKFIEAAKWEFPRSQSRINANPEFPPQSANP